MTVISQHKCMIVTGLFITSTCDVVVELSHCKVIHSCII